MATEGAHGEQASRYALLVLGDTAPTHGLPLQLSARQAFSPFQLEKLKDTFEQRGLPWSQWTKHDNKRSIERSRLEFHASAEFGVMPVKGVVLIDLQSAQPDLIGNRTSFWHTLFHKLMLPERIGEASGVDLRDHFFFESLQVLHLRRARRAFQWLDRASQD